MYQIRPMQHPDVAAVMALQTLCYTPELWENEATIASRLALAPNDAWVAEDALGVCAYLFAYRSMRGHLTALDGPFSPDAQGDCYYLHDLAVLPRMKGQGVGPALVQQALAAAKAQGIAFSALVSVQDSLGFWTRQGYQVQTLNEPQALAHLASYAVPAHYMLKVLE